MRWKSCSAVLAVIVGCASIAQAGPTGPGQLNLTGADALVIPVGGCHRSERNHYVPEVGRSLPHVHIGEDCEPYKLSDSDAGDDDDDDDDDDDTFYAPDDDDDSEICVELGGVDICS